MIKNEEDIILLIEKDRWMIEVLKFVKSLNLPDWWICAGFVRSMIWDYVHGFNKKTPLPDIDVIYFDPSNLSAAKDRKVEKQLLSIAPSFPWSVKNQARMHIVNQVPPYRSSEDAISKFPETATALGVKLDEKDKVVLTVPHGIQDAINLKIKPTPYFRETKERMGMYERRVRNKSWDATWSKITIQDIEPEINGESRREN